MKRVYGSPKTVMVGEEDEGSRPVKCRERRRMRLAMRRKAAGTSSGSALLPTENPSTAAAAVMETSPPPDYGVVSVIGRQREMEDEVFVRTNLCRPEINGFRPVHYFAVFDGHGGRHVSALCKDNMHKIMEEELMSVKVVEKESNGGNKELWKRAIKRCFQRMDEMVLRLCLCEGLIGSSSNICRCKPQLSFMGSTAVVSVLSQEYIFVANCGDSRAILCRNGMPVSLSFDHKPDREDERARIEGCGGRIMFDDGARVEGILAMSRAIELHFALYMPIYFLKCMMRRRSSIYGDRLLKQWVTSEPEISVTKRERGDECLILGSDGLWDVLSSELACKIVHEYLAHNENSGSAEPRIEGDEGVSGEALYSSRSNSAATLLVRLALGRRSIDNISVIVIDLRT